MTGSNHETACRAFLDKVRKLSESVAIFDPGPLKKIAVELGHTIRSKQGG